MKKENENYRPIDKKEPNEDEIMRGFTKEVAIAKKKLKDSNFRDISMINCYYCKHLIMYPEVNFCKIHSG